MGIPFTILMGFLFTITMGKLFTIAVGIQLTISKGLGGGSPPLSEVWRADANHCFHRRS